MELFCVPNGRRKEKFNGRRNGKPRASDPTFDLLGKLGSREGCQAPGCTVVISRVQEVEGPLELLSPFKLKPALPRAVEVAAEFRPGRSREAPCRGAGFGS